MATFAVTTDFSPNTVISSSAMNQNNADIEAAINAIETYIGDGVLTNAMLAGSIADSKLSQITTASKVHGTAITGLASLPGAAGEIPDANIGVISSADKLDGAAFKNLGSIPAGAGTIPVANYGAHGAAQHTDVTRSFLVNPAACHTDGTLTVGNTSYHTIIEMANNADTNVRFNFQVPEDYVSDLKVYLLWLSQTATSGNVLFHKQASWGPIDGTPNEHAVNTGMGLEAVGDDDILYKLDLTYVFTGITVGDLVGINVYRDGDDENDTAEGQIDFHGYIVEYTANQ